VKRRKPLKRKTPLRAKPRAKRLKTKPKTVAASRKWSKAVLEACERRCYFCGGVATEGAHIIGRAQIGTAKACCDPRIGVGLCHACHSLQTDNKIKFPLALRQKATEIINLYVRVAIPIPLE
jgi:hypothetical protein